MRRRNPLRAQAVGFCGGRSALLCVLCMLPGCATRYAHLETETMSALKELRRPIDEIPELALESSLDLALGPMATQTLRVSAIRDVTRGTDESARQFLFAPLVDFDRADRLGLARALRAAGLDLGDDTLPWRRVRTAIEEREPAPLRPNVAELLEALVAHDRGSNRAGLYAVVRDLLNPRIDPAAVRAAAWRYLEQDGDGGRVHLGDRIVFDWLAGRPRESPRVVELPLLYDDGKVWTRMTVAGESLDALLDTGNSRTFCTVAAPQLAVAGRWPLVAQHVEPSRGTHNRRHAWVGVGRDLHLGPGIEIPVFPIAIPLTSSFYAAGRSRLVLSNVALSRWLTAFEVEPTRRLIRLFVQRAYEPDPDMVAVPFEMDGGLIQLRVRVSSGLTSLCIFDTGDPGGLLVWKQDFESLHPGDLADAEERERFDVGGSYRERFVRGRTIGLGDLVLEGVEVGTLAEPRAFLRTAVLGVAPLAGRRYAVDYDRSCLWIEARPARRDQRDD